MTKIPFILTCADGTVEKGEIEIWDNSGEIPTIKK